MLTKQINTKSIARIAAVQTLYQLASSKGESDINLALIEIKEFYKANNFKSDHDISSKTKLKVRPSSQYLDELVKFTYENLPTINSVISGYLLKEWNIDNIPILLRALLQVAICEIEYFPETPKKVIINEYTDIASDMLDDNEIGFVNSVLHSYSHSKH